MDLIEKYGSYDAAKAKQQELSKMAADPRLLFVGNIIKEIGEIEIGLLDYRRQHNIFEVGDLVTYKAHFKGMWREGFGKITEIDEDLEVVNIDENVGVAISEIEHANDAEIKAGKRLEVKSDNGI